MRFTKYRPHPDMSLGWGRIDPATIGPASAQDRSRTVTRSVVPDKVAVT